MHATGSFGIKGEAELLVPVEAVSRTREGVVTVLSTGSMTGKVCGMCSDLVGNHALSHIFYIGQPEVFLRSYITKHTCAMPAG